MLRYGVSTAERNENNRGLLIEAAPGALVIQEKRADTPYVSKRRTTDSDQLHNHYTTNRLRCKEEIRHTSDESVAELLAIAVVFAL